MQEGVAARFRAERSDAQRMLAAEHAVATLNRAAFDPPTAPKESADAFLSPIASAMRDEDVRELLERYGDEARAAFESGSKVMVALRRQTNWKAAELGRYDDVMLVAWKAGGAIAVRRLTGTTEPAGAYAFGRERAAHGSSNDVDRDGRADMGRLRAGVYHYRPERHPRLGDIFRARDIQVTERDCNQDGRFTPGDTGAATASTRTAPARRCTVGVRSC